MRFLLACLALLPAGALALTNSNPYLGSSSTRTYYLAELEDCPGKLDMQPGDLWTLTFPDKLADAFVTRSGLVERRLQDNRLIIAVVGSRGSTPALVLTEDGRAPLFTITVQSGPGGRNKRVVVKPGLPPGGSRCGAAGRAAPRTAARAAAPTPMVRSAPAPSRPTTATVRPPVATPPLAGRAITPSTRPPVREVARAPAPAVTSTSARPARAVSAPAPARTTARAVTPPKPSPPPSPSPVRGASNPAPAAVTTRTAAAPLISAPTPSAQLTVKAVPVTPLSRAAAAPARPVQVAPTPVLPPSARRLPVSIRTQGRGVLRIWVVTGQKQRGVLTFTLSNSLDSGVTLRREDLHVAQASGSGRGALVIPAGQTLTFDVALKGPLPPVLGRLTWPGSVMGSRESFEISALLAL